jgi:hypothetical protein
MNHPIDLQKGSFIVCSRSRAAQCLNFTTEAQRHRIIARRAAFFCPIAVSRSGKRNLPSVSLW